MDILNMDVIEVQNTEISEVMIGQFVKLDKAV